MKIVITGGADGLGKEIVRQLLSHKHEVVLIDRKLENIEKASKDLGIKEIYQCDITESSQIVETTQKILEKHKKIDVLINNAGVWLDENKEEDLNEFKRMILVNLFGTIAITKSFLPRFLEQKGGHIVNINSQAGVAPKENSPVYSATKHGLVGYGKSVRQDLANRGIKLTDIRPGMIETELFVKAGVDFPKSIFNKFALTKDIVASVIVYVVELPENVAIPALEIRNKNEPF